MVWITALAFLAGTAAALLVPTDLSANAQPCGGPFPVVVDRGPTRFSWTVEATLDVTPHQSGFRLRVLHLNGSVRCDSGAVASNRTHAVAFGENGLPACELAARRHYSWTVATWSRESSPVHRTCDFTTGLMCASRQQVLGPRGVDSTFRRPTVERL